MKTEILRLLREKNGGYLSGQELCGRFGVSRTAVWKAVSRLREEGYAIESVPSKGYRLTGEPDALSESGLQSRLTTAWAGRTVLLRDETDSTNLDARRLMEEGKPHGTLVVAESQRAGRGRRGRVWESPPGRAVYMTIGLRPALTPAQAPMLTLVMALSVSEALDALWDIRTGIKWPNDVVVGKKKVCGILTELSVEADYIRHVVVGVGINAAQETFPEALRESATSLYLETGKRIGRERIIAAVLERFEKNEERLEQAGELRPMQEAYESRLVNLGRPVRVLDPKGAYDGTARGITGTGELLVETADGGQRRIYAGEVSVRGYYGYV